VNAQLLKVTSRVRAAATAAIDSRDVDELVASLQETLELLGSVVEDITTSRAEGAAIYATDPTFRQVVDEVTGED
jgi:hypothetical protein